MSDLDQWITECRGALAQAERLAAQLARLQGREALRLGKLQGRIANLRAAIEALDAMRALGVTEAVPDYPRWMSPANCSPWCAPDGEG
jgi:hypothetical protein